MNLKIFRPLIILSAFVFLIGLACSTFAGDPTATPIPAEPEATAVEPTAVPPTEAAPTEAPLPTETAEEAVPTEETGTEASAIEFDPEPYLHPSGLFSFNPPSGWGLEEDGGSVSFEAPDQSGFIYMQVTNTGYALDSAAFDQFVAAREVNFFGGFDNYQEIEQDMDGDVGTVTKSLVFDGEPQIVLTVYQQQDDGVYAFDFWADEDLFLDYSPAYIDLVDTLTLDSSAVSEQDVYQWVYTFLGPADLFSIEVPTSWLYERETDDETLVVDTFYSPDNHAIIQNIGYDDGSEVSRNDAGQFALTLLREFYADDVRITDDQIQEDGSERLTWVSPGGEYSGISFFETRGTTFLLFTTVWDDPYEDIYLEVLDYTIETYTIP